MTRLSKDLLVALQARAARAALAPSSMRGAGRAGVVKAGRPFLREIDLRRFATGRANRFRIELDQHTDGLLHAFPRAARQWGLARKGLNIFLRECLYCVYLRDAYALDRSEMFYEIPLDALTGAAIWKTGGGRVPRWGTIRGLRPVESDAYQRVAAELAATRGVAPVHLDAVWWGQRDE